MALILVIPSSLLTWNLKRYFVTKINAAIRSGITAPISDPEPSVIRGQILYVAVLQNLATISISDKRWKFYRSSFMTICHKMWRFRSILTHNVTKQTHLSNEIHGYSGLLYE